MARFSLLFVLLLTALLSRSAGGERRYSSDVYVWQARWTPSIDAAVTRAAPLIGVFHVLAAEIKADGSEAGVMPHWDRLADTGKPIIAVFRIDGRIDDSRTADLSRLIQTKAQSLKDLAPGLTGIEIDYDCPTSALSRYAGLLADLRGPAFKGLTLSVTALPTWFDAPAFRQVMAAADQVVLQVHAVDNPQAGLFNPEQAGQWADRMGRMTTKPFLLALPAYQVRVGWSPAGDLVSAEGETPVLYAGLGRELSAPPEAVAGLIHDLGRNPPRHLAGLVWFRLPADSDQRAWTFKTWSSVVSGVPLDSHIVVRMQATTVPGTLDLVAENDGVTDGSMPRAVKLPAGCRYADGAGGYRLDDEGERKSLRSDATELLRAGETKKIGWERCDD